MLRACVLGLLAAAVTAGPLWDYVNKPDPQFSWFDTNVTLSSRGLNLTTKGWDAYLLNVTSGTWLTEAESTCYVWTHQVLVVVPWELTPGWAQDNAALWITGGGNQNPGIPKVTSEDVLAAASVAVKTGTIAATIYQVPNENCVFTADPKQQKRGEDNIIAFTWMQFLLVQPDRPEWIVFFPMARACSRAMDAVTQFTQQKFGKQYTLSNWLTYGASKRGWTTWWTGVVDSRVKMIAPIVMDLLNFVPTINSMWKSLGNWTFAFAPYLDEGLPAFFGTPQLDPLLPLIDPLLSKENLTMPKLVIDSTGDEFFLIQDDYNWWGQLPGDSYRYMEANAEHSQATTVLRMITSIESFWLSWLAKAPRPVYNWTIDFENGAITAEVFGPVQPDKVAVSSATTLPGSCKEGVEPCIPRRDFRLVNGDTEWNPCPYVPVNLFGKACLRPIIWIGENIAPVYQNATYSKWHATQEFPPEGFWRGFMLEFFFPAPDNSTYKLTTQAAVIPNTYPFPTCVTEDCMKSLV